MADVTTTFAAKDESFAKTVEKLNARLEGFQKTVADFSGKVGNIAGSLGGMATKIGGIAAAFFGAQSAVQTFTQAINVGGELNELSARTGETAGNLAILQRAFQNAGSSGEAVGPMLNRLQRFMVEASTGGKQQTAVMTALGLSLDDLRGKPPTEQMALFARRISEIGDPAQRSAASMEVFGESGGELLPLLQNMSGEIDIAKAQLGGYPDAVNQAAASLDGIGDAFASITTKAQEFVTGALVKIAPQIEQALVTLSQIDFASMGMKLSEALLKTFDFFRGLWQNPSQILGLFSDYLNATFRMAGDTLIGAFLTSANAFRSLFGQLIDRDVFGRAADVLVTAFNFGVAKFASFLFEQFTKVVSYFGELWGRTTSMGASELASKLWDVVTAFGSDYVMALTNPLGFIANKLTSSLTTAAQASASEYQFAYDAATGSWIEKTQAGLDAVTEGAGKRFGDSATTFKDTLIAAGEAAVAQTEIVKVNLLGGAEAVEQVNQRIADIAKSGEEYRLQIEQTQPATNKIKEDATAVAGEGRNFATAINQAKVDATATAMVFTGLSDRMREAVNSTSQMLDKMRESFHFGRESSQEAFIRYREAGMSIVEASKAAADYVSRQSQNDSDLRSLEEKVRIAENTRDRAYERAERMERAGQERNAHNTRMRADADFTKKLEDLGPNLKKASEESSRLLKDSGGEGTAKKLVGGGEDTATKLVDAGNTVADVLTGAVKGDGKGGIDLSSISKSLGQCENYLSNIDKKLPQNALSA